MKRPKKTLVVGCDSFIGKGFYQVYKKIYSDTIGTDYRSLDLSRKIDLCTPDLAPLKLKKGEYSYALIAAANTNLALCEQEKGLSYRRNVEGVLNLAKLFIEFEITPILLSTAYVFDGVAGGYVEESKTCPINEYGKQKETVEKRIREVCGSNYLMIRCSKVFDLVKGSNTLIDQICSALVNGQPVKAAYDQIFCPISLDDLIGAVVALQEKNCTGLYNVCGSEIWSRLELAEHIGNILETSPKLIIPISLDEVRSPFRMPKRTDMRSEKFHSCVDFKMHFLPTSINQLKALYLPIERE